MYQSIPVCMYHHVNDHPDKYLTVSPGNFEDQMALLEKEGYKTLSSEEFRKYKMGLARFPRNSVMLTFDDAWLNVFANAFPILSKYRLKFTVFVVSERSERATKHKTHSIPNRFPSHYDADRIAETAEAYRVVCNWDHLREMINSGLCSVENHTATHGRINDTYTDIQKGKEDIESALGIVTTQLAWPRGKYDKEKLRIAKELGIDVAYTTRRGINPPFFGSMRVKRFTVVDRGAVWFKRQLTIFSDPFYGFLYGRLKPDRRKEKMAKWLGRG